MESTKTLVINGRHGTAMHTTLTGHEARVIVCGISNTSKSKIADFNITVGVDKNISKRKKDYHECTNYYLELLTQVSGLGEEH